MPPVTLENSNNSFSSLFQYPIHSLVIQDVGRGTIIGVPATVTSMDLSEGITVVTMETVVEGQQEHLLDHQLKGGHQRVGIEEVGTHPQVGGVLHEPIGMTTGVVPLPHRRRSQVLDPHGVTIGNFHLAQVSVLCNDYIHFISLLCNVVLTL